MDSGTGVAIGCLVQPTNSAEYDEITDKKTIKAISFLNSSSPISFHLLIGLLNCYFFKAVFVLLLRTFTMLSSSAASSLPISDITLFIRS